VTFTIPAWVLWTLGLLVGVPLVSGILLFAVIGIMLVHGLTRGRSW